MGQTPDSNGIAREPWPQLQFNNGDIITTPHLVVITFANAQYSSGITSNALGSFVQEMISQNYLHSVTSEYGVQNYTFDGAVVVQDTPPASLADTDVQAYIQKLINEGTVPRPVPGGTPGSSLYIIYYPGSTTVYEDTMMQAASCQAFLGYHGPAVAPSSPLGWTYAVIADCGPNGLNGPGGQPLNALQSIETATSHEITEAVTDPGPTVNDVGWAMTTMAVNDSAWQGLEVADMCIGIYAALGSNGDMVQRIWSNSLADLGGSPCNPAPSSSVTALFGIPYQLVAAPGQTIAVPVNSFSTQGSAEVSYSVVGGADFINAFGGGGVGDAPVGQLTSLAMTVPADAPPGSTPFSNVSIASNTADGSIQAFWAVDVVVQASTTGGAGGTTGTNGSACSTTGTSGSGANQLNGALAFPVGRAIDQVLQFPDGGLNQIFAGIDITDDSVDSCVDQEGYADGGLPVLKTEDLTIQVLDPNGVQSGMAYPSWNAEQWSNYGADAGLPGTAAAQVTLSDGANVYGGVSGTVTLTQDPITNEIDATFSFTMQAVDLATGALNGSTSMLTGNGSPLAMCVVAFPD